MGQQVKSLVKKNVVRWLILYLPL